MEIEEGNCSSSSDAHVQAPSPVRAPHVIGGPHLDYRIVIPTRGRWKEARLISTEHALRKERTPFILLKTLGFLKRQRIEPHRVSLWTADEAEKTLYRQALEHDDYWAGGHVQICVGVPGIRAQRNHIVEAMPENAYIVSIDDDLADVYWKQDAGVKKPLVPLPSGGLEPLIFHAYKLMRQSNAWIWGLSSTAGKNTRTMWMDGVSTRNGEINGFFYGFINRHDTTLLPQVADATEDAERSLRYFHKDKILLRYRMYCGDTKCFAFEEGLQGLFDGASLKEKWVQRKAAEREAADELHRMFPTITGPPKQKKGASTLEINFRPMGSFVLPTFTAEALRYANSLESASGRGGKGKENKAVSSDSPNSRTDAKTSNTECLWGLTRSNLDCQTLSPNADHTRGAGSAPSQKGVKRSNSESDSGKRSRKEKRSSSSKTRPSITIQLQGSNAEAWSPKARLSPSKSCSPERASLMIDIDSEDEEIGADENAAFERIFAPKSSSGSASQTSAVAMTSSSTTQAAKSNEQQEDEMIRRALEESLRDMVLLINGTVADPLAKAIAESQEEEERQQNLRRIEEAQIAESLRMSSMSSLERSISISESSQIEDSQDNNTATAAAVAVAPAAAGNPLRPCASGRVDLEDAGNPNLQVLVDMGFDKRDAQRAMRDSNGDIEVAAAILVSGAAI